MTPLRVWVARLPLAAGLAMTFLFGCATSDDGGGGDNGTECPPGQRIIDGECREIGRDVGREDTGAGSNDASSDAVSDAGGCSPGTRTCQDTQTVVICEEGGTTRTETCLVGQVCLEGLCVDETTSCTPADNLGCDDLTSYRVCNAAGDGYDVVECPAASPNCLVNGECTDQVCVPTQTRCAAGETTAVETCNADGDAWEITETCASGLTCDAGECLSPCEENAKVSSFLGCDYWALDLDNVEEPCAFAGDCAPNQTCNTTRGVCEPSAASQQFSVSISNPNDAVVNVTIENMATGAVTEHTVPAGTAQAIPLPRLDVDGTGRTRNAYHVTTDLPVTAHQFNPANNVGVFSNDASLLLPTNSAGLQFIVLAWPTGPFGAAGNAFGYATIVATDAEGPTTVQITPSVDVRAGGGVNAMLAEATTTVTLNQGDVLSLQTRAETGRDLSGTIIEADRPINVFGGHECAFVPDEGPTPYCDHIEQQLFPVAAWGTEYFGAKQAPRGTEVDVWRIVASQASTVITTDPPVSGVNGLTLNAGQVQEFTTNQNFRLTASAPVLLAQYMTGSNYPGIPFTCWQVLGADPLACEDPFFCPGTSCSFTGDVCGVECSSNGQCSSLQPPASNGWECRSGYCSAGTGVGDPAFTLAVPSNQYRDNYIFLTPSDYREDWFTVIAPIGTELTLDGQPLTAATLIEIGDTGFGVYHHNTSNPPGGPDPSAAHTLIGSQPFALMVYGYDCDVSYAYPGGLNLESGE